jgi:hypothetical protein
MFTSTSRYQSQPVVELVQPDGSAVHYARPRLIPQPDQLTVIATRVVAPADRLDRIAAEQYGDPEQAWRIADAHRVLDQDVLTEVAGLALRFALPAGLVGVPGG